MKAKYEVRITFELDHTAPDLAEQLRDHFYDSVAEWTNPDEYKAALVRVYETREV